MTKFNKIFGAGPRGLIISLVLLYFFFVVKEYFLYLNITDDDMLRYFIFAALSIITIIIIVWSVKSLPPSDRGNNLVTNGAFKYFRHPLYGAFLSFFNFGLAILLNNWIFIVWAIVQIPIWHWNVIAEENLMKSVFFDNYEKYSEVTGRFFPRVFRK